MLGRKIVKSKKRFFVFCQAFAGFWEFDLVAGDELIVGCQSCFASRRQIHFMDQLLRFALNTLRHLSRILAVLWTQQRCWASYFPKRSLEVSGTGRLAVMPNDTVAGNFVPKLDSSGIIMQHAFVCGTGLLFAIGNGAGW
jgi:hypothetical protein